VAEIELKVELVMEAAGKDKDENLGPADFEALMDPYSFQRLFTIHY
jgi:hypothetical protein